jgi:hypothetical protein
MTLRVLHRHIHKPKICLYSMHVECYPTRAEIPALPYCADTFMTSKSIKLRKTCEVTSFPQMFLERRHTTTFMPMRKETLIHWSLCLKWSLELKSFLASQSCTWTVHQTYSRHIQWMLNISSSDNRLWLIFRKATLSQTRN